MRLLPYVVLATSEASQEGIEAKDIDLVVTQVEGSGV